ncbi:hypothetical protein [Duncaniella freteri]|uniref:hypothetical protein n=1 Tax=Duncaniella freteri TaxID=2530391 RepID=UPI0014836406|nr:hypothetical protein [Duncaniella freteri]
MKKLRNAVIAVAAFCFIAPCFSKSVDFHFYCGMILVVIWVIVLLLAMKSISSMR